MIDQRRRGRTLRVEPIELVAEGMRLLEHTNRAPAEQPRIALVFHAKPAHRDAVDLLDAGRQLVPPRHVVGRAGRQDLDLGVLGEMLGDVARVQLGAAVDRLSVALHDDRELHC